MTVKGFQRGSCPPVWKVRLVRLVNDNKHTLENQERSKEEGKVCVCVCPMLEHHWPMTRAAEASQEKANRSRVQEVGSRSRKNSKVQDQRENIHRTGFHIE